MIDDVEFFRFIAYGYLRRNYSVNFMKSIKYHVVKKSIKDGMCTAVFTRSTGDGFNIYINVKHKKIDHHGDYSKNAKYPPEKIIEQALKKYNQ